MNLRCLFGHRMARATHVETIERRVVVGGRYGTMRVQYVAPSVKCLRCGFPALATGREEGMRNGR